MASFLASIAFINISSLFSPWFNVVFSSSCIRTKETAPANSKYIASGSKSGLLIGFVLAHLDKSTQFVSNENCRVSFPVWYFENDFSFYVFILILFFHFSTSEFRDSLFLKFSGNRNEENWKKLKTVSQCSRRQRVSGRRFQKSRDAKQFRISFHFL